MEARRPRGRRGSRGRRLLFIPPPQSFQPQVPNEYHTTGNEHGLQGRYAQHVGNVLGPIFKDLNLNVRMADYQAGLHVDSASGKAGIDMGMRQPGLVVIGASDGVIRVVGELKTYWTFHPRKGQSDDDYVQDGSGRRPPSKWPTLVLESAVTKSHAKLLRDATWWFERSNRELDNQLEEP